MTKDSLQSFGGGWTEQKLTCLRKYLWSYYQILKETNFQFAYIDAFAGTGWREVKPMERSLFVEEEEANRFRKGSAKIGLEQRGFHRYIFIEKDPEKAQQLEALAATFPEANVTICPTDANSELLRLCRRNWRNHRALLFLDPFGLSIPWTTLQAIANTKAIDMWLLLATGTINRMLPNDHTKLTAGNRRKLIEIFGDEDFVQQIYYEKALPSQSKPVQTSLFDEEKEDLLRQPEPSIERVDLAQVGAYWLTRLETCFPGVARPPLWLYNSKNSPIFLLCFAAANPKGAPTAVRIASHIIGHS